MKNDAIQRRAGGVKLSTTIFCVTVLVAWLPTGGRAQVNSGSNGSDGAFNPTAASTVINMADHPNGIYQYTSVNISNGVTVIFTPNANNTPVTWLVQSNVVINGTVDVSGQSANSSIGALGGAGGGSGGNGGSFGTSGKGLGGGMFNNAGDGANASYGSAGQTNANSFPPGPTYGNIFLIPLLGGSGGGGSPLISAGGGGGGGAIEIAASGTISLGGSIIARGGQGSIGGGSHPHGGSGSGGGIRLIATKISGNGSLNATGGSDGGIDALIGGLGRVRLDAYDNEFAGGVSGQFTQGSQFIIIPSAGQLPQLTVTSVGGVPVSASPTGVLSTPDAVLSAQQNNPIPIIVSCANLPLNTHITVSVAPMNGSPISAVGYNTTGTQASSTATISINMPRGGGLIYATAATAH
jgi:hypothetical protein